MEEVKLPGSARPLKGKCGSLLRHWEIKGQGKKRYCTRPAGWGCESHPGRGQCQAHLGNAPSVIRHWEKIKMEEEVAKAVQTLSKRLGQPVTMQDPLVELVKLTSQMLALRDVVIEKMDSIANDMTITDRAGVERSRAMLDKLVEVLSMVRDTLVSLQKLDIMGRKIALEEDQAHMIAGVVLAVLTSPTVALDDIQLGYAREILAQRLSELGPSLRPKDLAALDEGDLQQAIDAEIVS